MPGTIHPTRPDDRRSTASGPSDPTPQITPNLPDSVSGWMFRPKSDRTAVVRPRFAGRTRTVVAGGLVAACLAFVGACGAGPSDGGGDSAGATAPVTTATDTPAVLTVPAPLNEAPEAGQDPADATLPGADAPAESPVTGPPTQTQLTALTDAPEPAPVSTAGPIAPVGNIDQVVAEVPVTTAAPVALTEAADFGGQVSARIAQVSAVHAEATLPGEVSGPAVAVTVEVTNGSTQAIGLDSVTVTMADSAGDPAAAVSADLAAPLQGVLDPGKSARGTYVFTVSADRRSPVTVTANYSAAAPTVAFSGPVSGG